jgi:hypothetical protein
MPDVRETTIHGTKYRMTLLRGESATRAACIVTGPALRAVDKLLEKIDLANGFEALGAKDMAAIPAVAAEVFDAVGFQGVMALTAMFAEQTTVLRKSPAHGAGDQLFEVKLSLELDDHFVGKWPAQLAWLIWGVMSNGFLDVSGILAELVSASAQAKALLKSQKESTGFSGG